MIKRLTVVGAAAALAVGCQSTESIEIGHSREKPHVTRRSLMRVEEYMGTLAASDIQTEVDYKQPVTFHKNACAVVNVTGLATVVEIDPIMQTKQLQDKKGKTTITTYDFPYKTSTTEFGIDLQYLGSHITFTPKKNMGSTALSLNTPHFRVVHMTDRPAVETASSELSSSALEGERTAPEPLGLVDSGGNIVGQTFYRQEIPQNDRQAQDLCNEVLRTGSNVDLLTHAQTIYN